ncbi:glycoside hydrolase family 36 protein [Planctomycetota bacterium]
MKHIYLSLLIGVSAFAGARTPPEWDGITVSVHGNHAVTTSQKLTEERGGLQRLELTLSNKGSHLLILESIEIRIPLRDPIADDMEVVYGSSCMGQRPVLRHKVGKPQKKSESYMYSMVQKVRDEYIFAGALSWRIFIPVFTLEDNAFVVRSNGEGKQLRPGESIQYERIVLARSSDWQDMLDSFGSAIAEENGIRRLKDVDFKGWATWDYYAYRFSAEDIYENAKKIKQLAPTANLVQIDAGWYAQRGDFAMSRPDLSGGMKEVAERIKVAGMIPGIWVDGFRANTDSEVCKKHPAYFLHDQGGNMIVQVRRNEGVDRDRVYLDYSHPGARAHMAASLRVIREEWGIPYVKIDFMRFGLNQEILRANPTVKSIKAYDPTITDVERMRLGLQVMRETLGPDCYILGCSAVFGPCIGFVDGMRTGGDISPRYETFSERSLANVGNYYLSGKVFNGDADYLVFREAVDEDESVSKEKVKHGGSLTRNEAQMWADFNKLYGTCRLSSDKLMTLRPERQALLPEVFNFPAMDETVPLDFWNHGKDKSDGYELLLARHGNDIYLGIFNWSDKAKEYSLPAFGRGVQRLNERHSKVLEYTGSLSFGELCKTLISSLQP